MSAVRLATLLGPPQRHEHDMYARSHHWTGDVLAQNGSTHRVWIKRVPPREAHAEAICATLAPRMKWPMPRIFRIHDPAGFMPDQATGELLGSEDTRHPSLRRWIIAKDCPELTEALLRWPQLERAAVADEWLAHYDRNPGNLTFDGADKFSLIDQARAFDACDMGATALLPAVYGAVNGLWNVLALDCTRARIEKATRDELALMDDTLVKDLIDAPPAAQMVPPAFSKSCETFLRGRLQLLLSIMRRRVGAPELPLP